MELIVGSNLNIIIILYYHDFSYAKSHYLQKKILTYNNNVYLNNQ